MHGTVVSALGTCAVREPPQGGPDRLTVVNPHPQSHVPSRLVATTTV